MVPLPRWKAEGQHNYIQYFFPLSSVKYNFSILGNFIFSFVMDIVVFRCALKQTLRRVISQIWRLLAEIRLKKSKFKSESENNTRSASAENNQ